MSARVTKKAASGTNGLAKNRLEAVLAKAEASGKKAETVKVIPLRQKTIQVRLTGTAPYMQAKFSQKALDKMMATQLAGQQAKSKKVRTARDFDGDYEGATHRIAGKAKDRFGIPAGAFRNACISACKLVGFAMTVGKLSIFVEADGFDATDGTPLVEIHGKRERTEMPARNANGSCDIRVRPMWREWYCNLRIRFDEDQFSASDIINLLIRVGSQVGIGEGRPDSRKSNGMGFGLFAVEFAEDR